MYYFEIFRFVDPDQCADECTLLLSTCENCLDGDYDEIGNAIDMVRSLYPALYFEEQAENAFEIVTSNFDHPAQDVTDRLSAMLIKSGQFKPLNMEH